MTNEQWSKDWGSSCHYRLSSWTWHHGQPKWTEWLSAGLLLKQPSREITARDCPWSIFYKLTMHRHLGYHRIQSTFQGSWQCKSHGFLLRESPFGLQRQRLLWLQRNLLCTQLLYFCSLDTSERRSSKGRTSGLIFNLLDWPPRSMKVRGEWLKPPSPPFLIWVPPGKLPHIEWHQEWDVHNELSSLESFPSDEYSILAPFQWRLCVLCLLVVSTPSMTTNTKCAFYSTFRSNCDMFM